MSFGADLENRSVIAVSPFPPSRMDTRSALGRKAGRYDDAGAMVGLSGGRLLIVAESGVVGQLAPLFAARGLMVVGGARHEEVRAFLAGEKAAAVIVDLVAPWSARILAILTAATNRPVVIGLLDSASEVAALEGLVDDVMVRPFDPARLVERTALLVSSRQSGKSVWSGDALFHRLLEELEIILLPTRSAALLEEIVHGAGARPADLTRADVLAILDSGELAAALADLASPSQVEFVIDRIRLLLRLA